MALKIDYHELQFPNSTALNITCRSMQSPFPVCRSVHMHQGLHSNIN